MTDNETREWLEALFGPRRQPAEPTDDPMRQFADALFQRAQEGE